MIQLGQIVKAAPASQCQRYPVDGPADPTARVDQPVSATAPASLPEQAWADDLPAKTVVGYGRIGGNEPGEQALLKGSAHKLTLHVMAV